MARKTNGHFGTLEQVGEILAKHHMGEPLTYEEIGLVFGMTKAGVRAIEMRALTKLKAECEKRGLTLEDVRAILHRDASCSNFTGRVDDTTQD